MTDATTVCMQANEPQCHCCYKMRAIERECLDCGHTEVDARARLAIAEKALAKVREVADDLWRGGCDCGHLANLHTERDGCIGGLWFCSCSRSWSSIATGRIHSALDGTS